MNTHGQRHSLGGPSSHRLQRALVALLGLLIAACSSGGGTMGAGSSNAGNGGSSSCSSCGTAVVSMTDAPGDFLSYIVNLDSLSLTRSDGTVVQTVPATAQVDLAQLVNLSEIVSAAQVPAGRYVSVALTVDFNGATVVVDNGSGTGVTIAQANLINGVTSQPLAPPNSTQMTLTLSLAGSNQLVVNAGTVANLALDFNLAASNTISPAPTNPTSVTVNPVVTASLAPDISRQLRVRGPLVSVNSSASSFLLRVVPFYLPVTTMSAGSTAGQFTVDTSSTTTYAINGSSYTGGAGLAALAAAGAGTLTVAYGSWDEGTQSFTATQVLAGSSVGGSSGLTGVQATVLARSGNTLTLANDVILRPQLGVLAFAPQITATIGSGTTVSELGQSGAFTIADISVGQQLLLSGSLSGTGSSLALDATGGNALLQPTPLLGTLTATGGNPLTLNLLSLGGYAAGRFNFAGTGASSAQDANASAYSVAVPAALLPPASSVGQAMRFYGFVAPFGSAPPDFNALSSVSFAGTAASLDVRWPSPGIPSPFATLTGSQLLISQSTLKAASEEQIELPSLPPIDPSTLSSGLQLVPDEASGNAQGFAIVHWSGWKIDTFASFNDLASALSSDLNGTTTALRLFATGPYDAATGTLTADHVVVVLDN